MASLSVPAAHRLRLPAGSLRFLAAVLAVPVLLGIARALPAEGAGLGLRLAAAGALVLLVPGALVLRAFGWLPQSSLALAGSFACSLAVCFLAFALTFAAEGSLGLTLALIAAVSAGALLASLRVAGAKTGGEARPLAALAAIGLALGAVVWWAESELRGQELWDVARVRKLDEVPVLFSIRVVDEFWDGSPHPGHAFPLWHGVLALVGRLAGVDADAVVQHSGALLVPLALALAYAAGAALFASRSGGVATALGQLVVGLGASGLGSFARLAEPHAAGWLLILPALLALVFGWIASGRRVELLPVAAAGFALAAVHGALGALVAVPLAGFALLRLATGGAAGRLDAGRTAAGLAACVVPVGLVAAWLSPLLWETNAFVPTGRQEDLAVAASGGELYALGPLLGLHPLATVVGGIGVAAGLAAVLAGLTALRERWAAYVVGGTAAVFLVLVFPPFFTAAAELVSLPQARRLVLVAPLPFALAGACVVLARFLPARLGSPAFRLVAAATVVAVPFVALGLAGVQRDRPDPRALPAGLVTVLREEVRPRAVVFADLETSHRVAAVAPLLVAATPPHYVGRTASNDALQRRRDVIRFFWHDGASYLDRAALLARRGATWLLVDRRRRPPAYVDLLAAPVYDDGAYALYHLRRSRE